MEKGYNTKQRANILDYLKQNDEKHITAEDIINYFKDIGKPVGKSTVYRYLETLVKENKIRKYVSSENNAASCFQYINNQSKCSNHYHMKCTSCGNLIHLACDEINELSDHIYKEHKFMLDTCKTVLYGICEKCLNKKEKQK